MIWWGIFCVAWELCWVSYPHYKAATSSISKMGKSEEMNFLSESFPQRENDVQDLSPSQPDHNAADRKDLAKVDMFRAMQRLKRCRGPGIDHFRSEHLQQLFNSRSIKHAATGEDVSKLPRIVINLLSSMTWLFQQLQDGKAPRAVFKFIASVKSSGIVQTANGKSKMRSIGIGTMTLKLLQLMQFNSDKDALESQTKDIQFGTQQNGAEKIVHAAVVALSIDESFAVISEDHKNAFQTISRDSAIKFIRENNPENLPSNLALYKHPHDAWISGDKEANQIRVPVGMSQGKVASAPHYCMADAPLLKAVDSTLQRESEDDDKRAFAMAYIDDKNFIGSVSAVMATDEVFTEKCPETTQEVNFSKKMVLLPEIRSNEKLLEITGRLIDLKFAEENILMHPTNLLNTEEAKRLHGLIICGAPVSTFEEFIYATLQAKTESFEKQAQCLMRLDGQELHVLIKYCFTQKFTHLMRTIFPSIIFQFVEKWDAILKTLFAKSIGVSVTDLNSNDGLPWDVARLHAADGGMGMYYLEDRVHAAFVASVISCLEVVVMKNPEIKIIIDDQIMEEQRYGKFNLNPPDKGYSIPRTIKELLKSIAFLRENGIKLQGNPVSLESLTKLKPDQFKHLQAALTEGFRKGRTEYAKTKMNSTQLIIFQSGASGPAGSFTDLIPNEHPHSRMEKGQWHNTGRRRCLVRDTANEGTPCVCKSRFRLDHNQVHLQTCAVAGGGGRHETHDGVKMCIMAMLNAVGLKATTEKLLNKGDDKKRMDIVVKTMGVPGFNDATLDMDVTVVNAMTSRSTNSSAHTNATLDTAVAKKSLKYNDACTRQGHKFMALAFNVQGNWHDHFRQLFELSMKLSGESERSFFVTYWMRRISITIQKGVANHLIAASDRVHKRLMTSFMDDNFET